MTEYRRRQEQAKGKAEEGLRLAVESELPMEELVSRAREDLESLATEIGLRIIRQVMEAEVEKKVGRWGQQFVRRHVQQPGYVIFGGRKVQLERPRLRSREDKEVGLDTYAAFQENGKMPLQSRYKPVTCRSDWAGCSAPPGTLGAKVSQITNRIVPGFCAFQKYHNGANPSQAVANLSQPEEPADC